MMYAILYKVTKKGTGNMGCRIMPTSILTTTERANFENPGEIAAQTTEKYGRTKRSGAKALKGISRL
jgi:hypothetical protein